MQKKDYEDDDRRLMESWLYSVGTALALLVLIAVACLFGGCSTTKYVPAERIVIRSDTVHSVKLLTDYVIQHDSVAVFQKGDTVYQTKYRDRLRYSERVDTVYQSAVDSVKVNVPYPVERELTKWEKTKMDFGGIAIGAVGTCVIAAIVALVIWIIKKKWRK